MLDDDPPLAFIPLEDQFEAEAPPEVMLLDAFEVILLVPEAVADVPPEVILPVPDAEAQIPLVDALTDTPPPEAILPDA